MTILSNILRSTTQQQSSRHAKRSVYLPTLLDNVNLHACQKVRQLCKTQSSEAILEILFGCLVVVLIKMLHCVPSVFESLVRAFQETITLTLGLSHFRPGPDS